VTYASAKHDPPILREMPDRFIREAVVGVLVGREAAP